MGAGLCYNKRADCSRICVLRAFARPSGAATPGGHFLLNKKLLQHIRCRSLFEKLRRVSENTRHPKTKGKPKIFTRASSLTQFLLLVN